MNRIPRIYENIEDDLNFILIHNGTEPMLDLSFFYATGLYNGLFEGAYLFMYPDGRGEIITSILEEESASRASMPVSVFSTGQEREEMLKSRMKGAERIGINASGLTVGALNSIKKLNPDAEYIDIGKAIDKARMIKDSEELAAIRKAAEIASEVGDLIRDFVKPGMREYEVAAEIVYQMQKRGATGPAFETIASAGPNTAEPHYTSGTRTIQEGDFFLYDYGARYRKYNSDTTRTIVIGRAIEEQKRMYEVVLDAQLSAIDAIHAGVNAKDIHNIAAEIIDNSPYKGRFIHSLGHGLGLATHDSVGFSPANDMIVEKNMVITVEPGVYVPGFGGVRIEDDIVVTADGCEVLTSSKKDFFEVL